MEDSVLNASTDAYARETRQNLTESIVRSSLCSFVHPCIAHLYSPELLAPRRQSRLTLASSTRQKFVLRPQLFLMPLPWCRRVASCRPYFSAQPLGILLDLLDDSAGSKTPVLFFHTSFLCAPIAPHICFAALRLIEIGLIMKPSLHPNIHPVSPFTGTAVSCCTMRGRSRHFERGNRGLGFTRVQRSAIADRTSVALARQTAELTVYKTGLEGFCARQNLVLTSTIIPLLLF